MCLFSGWPENIIEKEALTVSLAFMFIFQSYSTLHNHFISEFFISLKIHSVDSTLFKLIQICSSILKWLWIYVTLTLPHDFALLF